jgi:hypothetical protein
VTSQAMTTLGLIGGIMALALPGAPEFLPPWVVWLMGLTAGGINIYTGKTNVGTKPKTIPGGSS